MSEFLRQPSNKNFLSPLGFKFVINKTPNMNFFVQSVDIPDVSNDYAEEPTPFKRIPYVGTELSYGDLQITFKIAEDMSNYIEIFNWITGIGFPENFEQRAELQNQPLTSGQGLYSDATLIILSSSMNPVMEVSFKDLFPVLLSSVRLDSTTDDVTYVEATATFKFTSMKMNAVI